MVSAGSELRRIVGPWRGLWWVSLRMTTWDASSRGHTSTLAHLLGRLEQGVIDRQVGVGSALIQEEECVWSQ